MQKTKESILQQILDQGMLPLFYTDSPTVSVEVVRTVYKAGVRVLEYTNRGTAALENFKLLKKTMSVEAPDLSLGVGTVKSSHDAHAFIAAGADFIVAPLVNPQVAVICNGSEMLWIPGCMTPTEIFLAQQHHAKLIKIFPANIVGPAFISSIREIFRDQLFMPTGGVELNVDNIRMWFKSGVCAVGLGGRLITKTILEGEQYDLLYKNTVEAIRLVSAARK